MPAITDVGFGQGPRRADEVVGVAIAMSILTVLSTTWRLAVRFRISTFMGCSDWLMFAGTVLNFICNIPFVLHNARNGMGYAKDDAFWTPEHLSRFNHTAFISICMQTCAMFLVKLSICSYLLGLNFSRKFRVVIWLVVLVVVIFGLVLPSLLHWFYCQPFYYSWTPGSKPHCWPQAVGTVAEYAQIVSNIATDLVYAAAPLTYLSQANLTPRLRWIVRMIFLLALIGTACTVVKTIYLHTWLNTSEPFIDIVPLSVWSINEISICIIVANLPMQRKCISMVIGYVVPERFHTRLGLGVEEELESRDHDNIAGTYPDSLYRSVVTTRDGPGAGTEELGEMKIVELPNGRIVMVPVDVEVPGPAVVKPDRRSAGTLATFWRGDEKDPTSSTGTLTTFWKNDSKDSLT